MIALREQWLRIHGGLTRRCTRRGAVRWPGTEVAYLLLNLHGVTARAVRSRLYYRYSRPVSPTVSEVLLSRLSYRELLAITLGVAYAGATVV